MQLNHGVKYYDNHQNLWDIWGEAPSQDGLVYVGRKVAPNTSEKRYFDARSGEAIPESALSAPLHLVEQATTAQADTRERFHMRLREGVKYSDGYGRMWDVRGLTADGLYLAGVRVPRTGEPQGMPGLFRTTDGRRVGAFGVHSRPSELDLMRRETP